VSRDWEEDILEWVGNKQVKKLQSGNLVKFVISIFTAIGGFGGGWYKMESRVSALEAQMAKKENISTIELEIARLKRDRELIDLKHAIPILNESFIACFKSINSLSLFNLAISNSIVEIFSFLAI
jgi:hypothetical protein